MSTTVRESLAQSWSARLVAVEAGEVSTVATADVNRRQLTVVNAGAVTIYLSHIASAMLTNAFPLVAGAGFEFHHAEPVYAFLDPAEVTDGVLSTLTETGER